jgi:rod shape-determining protein MreD
MIQMRVALIVVVAYLLQLSLFASLRIDGVSPELPLLLSILIGLHIGAEAGVVVGFFIGLSYDLALGTPLGLWALVCCLVAYPLGVASASLDRRSGIAIWLLVGLLSAGGIAGFALTGAIFGRTEFLRGITHIIAFATVYNLLLTPLADRGLRWALASGGRVRAMQR